VPLVKTLLQIRTALARRASIAGASGDTSSADLTAPVLNEFINDAMYESREIIVEKWLDYYTRASTTPSVIGQGSYQVQSDFYKLRRLWKTDDGVRFTRIYPGDIDTAHEYTGNTTPSGGYRYRLMARDLILMPVPATVFTIKLHFVPIQAELINDTDTLLFDVPVELKLLVAIAWRDCLDAQELDPSPAIAKIDAFAKLLRTSADARDANEPYYLDAHMPRRDDEIDEVW
jgi:hypothetical protein